jgi:hypothetical protein
MAGGAVYFIYIPPVVGEASVIKKYMILGLGF